jgi:hypothetical protein
VQESGNGAWEGTNGLGGEAENKESESEDEDMEATKRYWEVKRKKDGGHKVGIMCCDMFMI